MRPVNRSFHRRSVALAVLVAGCAFPIPAAAQQGRTVEGQVVPPPSRDVTPPGVLPGPAADGPLIRESVPVPDADPPRWHRFFLPQTTDAATFVADGRTMAVSGVTPPPPDLTCPLGDGTEWPCGRTALHSLRMFLRGRAVECYFPWSGDVTEVVAPCRVGSTDIGAWLLDQGWAEADDLATDDYRAAEHDARCRGAGLWRGRAPPDDCVRP